MNTTDKMDLDLTTTRFANMMPTLKYVFLTTCGHTYAIPSRLKKGQWLPDRQQTLNKWLSSKAWLVIRDDQDEDESSLGPTNAKLGSCTELSRETAERVVDREELQLSRHEEVRGFSLHRLRLWKLTRHRTRCETVASPRENDPSAGTGSRE